MKSDDLFEAPPADAARLKLEGVGQMEFEPSAYVANVACEFAPATIAKWNRAREGELRVGDAVSGELPLLKLDGTTVRLRELVAVGGKGVILNFGSFS